jgi:tRNA threonylcarbamoyladenosine biosynthesis protein TsaE
MIQRDFYLADTAAQEKLAHELAKQCASGAVIFLRGELGAGKTTFVRGFLRALGYEGVVKSPTYTLVEPYDLDGRLVYHFDLYRLVDPEELEYAGGRDYFGGESICLVEWPEKALGYLPQADIDCAIHYLENGRQLHLQALTDKGIGMLEAIPEQSL